MTAPHAILGIPETATQDEIRTAWRALVRRSHPDLSGNSAAAENRMKAINAAHDAMLAALVRAKESAAEERRRAARAKTKWAAAPRTAPRAQRDRAGNCTPRQPRPAPERPFDAPRRMKPDAVQTLRMRAALAGRLRRYLDRETARLGGPAYTVPGQPGWHADDALFARGGLPETHLVTRIDVEGRTIRLTLDRKPAAGSALIALPRLVQTGTRHVRKGSAVAVIAVEFADGATIGLRLSEEQTAECVEGAAGIAVELRFPPHA